MIAPGLGHSLFSSVKAMNSGVSTILKTGNPHTRFNSSISLPLNQHPEDKGLCSYEVLLRALGGYSNDTPEEASQEDGASPPGVESTAGSGVVPVTSAGEPAAQIQGRLHEKADNLPLEKKSSKGAEDSSSGIGTPSSEAGTLPEEPTPSPEQPALFSEEENWVIKIPKKTSRCQPLLGSSE